MLQMLLRCLQKKGGSCSTQDAAFVWITGLRWHSGQGATKEFQLPTATIAITTTTMSATTPTTSTYQDHHNGKKRTSKRSRRSATAATTPFRRCRRQQQQQQQQRTSTTINNINMNNIDINDYNIITTRIIDNVNIATTVSLCSPHRLRLAPQALHLLQRT